MTGALSRRSKEPTTCFVCQGMASAIGVCRTNPNGHSVPPYDAWVCHDCTRTAKELIRMTPKDVGRIEAMAMEAVARKPDFLDEGIQVFIGALFDAGVDKLSEATADQISMAKDRIVLNAEAAPLVQAIVLAFGDEVRASVQRGDAPF